MNKETIQSKPWERHLQSILTPLVLVGIIWLGATAVDNAKTIAVMANDIGNMKLQFTDFKISMKDRFTGGDGVRLQSQVDRLEETLRQHLATHKRVLSLNNIQR